MTYFYHWNQSYFTRGCYVILPLLGQDRLDCNDNTAEAEREVDVLEGPEVEISSCELPSGSNGAQLDIIVAVAEMEPSKTEGDIPKPSNDLDTKDQDGTAPSSMAAAEPDNKFYEVEAIIDGPKRRREHLFKTCFKVRWKGYGPEADTWQPTKDLYNVQDMVLEYKKEKAEKARKKRKLAPKSGKEDSENGEKLPKSSATVQRRPSHEDSSDEDENDYDPEYGTVKDKFWKDLELGRHQNHAQLFSGDMYSKVKGCRRAAHAEAVANIQKQQQPPSKTEAPDSDTKTMAPAQKLSVKLKFHRMAGKKNKFAASSSSGVSISTKKSPLQRIPSTASRARKRSSDPFSASGYTSAKRSRRSKEAKAVKRNSLSSVTSETVGIVTTTGPFSPTPLVSAVLTDSTSTTSLTSTSSASEAPSMSVSSLDTSNSNSMQGQWNNKYKENLSEVETDENFKTPAKAQRINICSDPKPPITFVQQLSQEEDVISAEEIIKLSSDENFPSLQSDTNDSAPSAAVCKPKLPETNNPLSDGSDGFAEGITKENEVLKPLTCDKEKGIAIEKSHDQECLWGGACNRSDCRSNRRRNMKNGQGESSKGGAPGESVSSESISSTTNSTSTSSSTASPSTPAKRLGSNTSIAQACPSQTTFQKQNTLSAGNPPPNHPQMSASSTKAGSSTGEASKASVPKSLFSSSRAQSSDSSFDDSPQSGGPPEVQLNKEIVSETFQRVSSPSSRPQAGSSAGSSPFGKGLVSSSSSSRQPAGQRNIQGIKKTSFVNSDTAERPGLFSEGNNAFSFARQDSGFSGDSPSSATVYPSPTSSINLSSPGKENFRSAVGTTTGFTQPVSSSTSRLAYQVPQSMEVDRMDAQPDSTVATVSASPVPISNHHRSFIESQEAWASGRKRNVDLPLEKIPSPNSKKESDIDRRISTLTCDDLEDFVDQGEERFGQKESSFITNADLLQAVILNKAEVVKKAIRLSCSSESRLDFEQPDNTGHTLLMKAVQKGSIAITEMLLEHGVKVNAQQANGMTALMIAAEQNNTGLLALLLKYGANSSLYTVHADQAETAIMKAIKRQQKEAVGLMLRVGVNLAAPTCSSLSVLEFAVERRNPQIEALVRTHSQRLEQAFRNRVLATLGGTVELMDPLFALQCFPLREAQEFEIKFNSFIPPLAVGEGFILFIAHTKINDKGVRCRFHGGCPISHVVLNSITQSPLTKEVNFVTSCHPIVTGCNMLKIYKQADYTSKAKLLVQAFRAKLLPC